MNNHLEAKVKAVNAANAFAPELYNKLAPIFTPFVGHKILKNDGSLLAKVEKLIPEFPHGTALHVYRYNSKYSLVYMVKTCVMIDDRSCTYHETSVYIAELEADGTIIKIHEPPTHLRSDYTVEEIANKRKAVDAAEKAYEGCKSALYPFDRYNR